MGENFIGTVVRLMRAGQRAYARKWTFLFFFFFIFFGSVAVLGALDLLPEASKRNAGEAVATGLVAGTSTASAQQSASEFPVRIEIPKIGLSAVVGNPTTTAISGLDEALKH